MACPRCEQAEADLKFAQDLIVDLQHLIRDLRHEIENFKAPLAQVERKAS